MNLINSLLRDLVTEYKNLRPQIYFKSSIIALARATQDLVLADDHPYLVIANFQQERFFRQQKHRFQKMASKSDHVYILGVPDAESSFGVDSPDYETIPICGTDTLAGERYLVIIGERYAACLAVRDKLSVKDLRKVGSGVEQGERFEGIWTFDRDIVYTAADWLLGIIANYRPELKNKVKQARKLFRLRPNGGSRSGGVEVSNDLNIFAQRLVTYLQAGQYKLHKAYQAIATAERKESLINKIVAAQRSSLDAEEILQTTVKELGQLFPYCRCLLYRLDSNDAQIEIKYEFRPSYMKSLVGQMWSIADNPLFIAAQAQKSTLAIEDINSNPYLRENLVVKDKIAQAGIYSWLMVSIRYQGTLLGMLELHYGQDSNFQWKPEDIALIEAIATSAGAALTQASAYSNLIELNAQLESVERMQSNLIAIVGHELRTPLSTIRVCLESLATEPDMLPEFRDVMLDTALGDSDRLGQLIQDFLTISKLEAGNAYSNIESTTIDYALNLALKRIKTTDRAKEIPTIKVDLPDRLPCIMADVDGLMEVFIKLLDNACKFTPADGLVTITARVNKSEMLEVAIADTGRGIELDRLEVIFDRFSQSESYLRRTVSGVGLGLIICRKIVRYMGGEIWATSRGENKGSQFYFTLAIAEVGAVPEPPLQ